MMPTATCWACCEIFELGTYHVRQGDDGLPGEATLTASEMLLGPIVLAFMTAG